MKAHRHVVKSPAVQDAVRLAETTGVSHVVIFVRRAAHHGGAFFTAVPAPARGRYEGWSASVVWRPSDARRDPNDAVKAAKLTPAQRGIYAEIRDAGPDGLVLDKSIVSAHGLLRKGLVTREDVEHGPATKFYSERHKTHTIRGRLRFVTMSRYRVVSRDGTHRGNADLIRYVVATSKSEHYRGRPLNARERLVLAKMAQDMRRMPRSRALDIARSLGYRG